MKKILALLASWWRSTVETDVVLKEYRCFGDIESSLRGCSISASTDNVTDTYDSISSINYQSLHYDVIKQSLKELSKLGSSQFTIPEEIEWHSISSENLETVFKNASDSDINIGFLWAAFMSRSDLLAGFLELGAQLSFYEHNYGLGALHLLAYSGCKKGTEYLLLQRGCYVNLMCKCYSPLHCAAFGNSPEVAAILLEKGANIDAFTNHLHCNLEGVLHCAVRANAVGCLKLFSEKGANINQLDSSGRTSIHLAAELGHTECLQVLVEAKGANIDQQTKEKLLTALHFAAYNQHLDCINVLLDHGAISTITDYKHRTPLHLAAKNQCNDCVKLLLRKGKANPNLQDTYQKTPLHLAVAKTTRVNCSDTIKTLIRYGAEINEQDSEGYTPLHLAARHELSECVETLILCGADIMAKCKPGITALRMICQKTPTSVDAIRKKLDESIVFNHHDSTNKELELQIDFTPILQYCHPREISFLSTLLDEGQKELLLHPVNTAFLHLKWKKIRKFFVYRAVGCFLLVMTMSAYVLMGLAKHCYNISKNVTFTTYEQDRDLCMNHSFSGYLITKHPYIIELQWYLMVVFAILIILRKVCSINGYSSFFHYVGSIENILDWGTVITVFLISFVYTGRTYLWQNHVSAFGVLLGWTNFLYILGQFPFFGTYVAMYSTVQGEFAKLLVVFSSLLIGFTVSFCVLFPESEVFSNIYIGFITVLVMAIGEMDLDLITKPSKEERIFMLEGSMEIIYTTFVTCVTIILLNLLVGIAVHDIQGLRKTATLAKLTSQTKLIYRIERTIYTDYFHRRFLSQVCRWSTLVSAKGYCVLKVKLHNHREKTVPEDILQAAYEVARKHKRKNKINLCKMCNQHNQKSLGNMNSQLKVNNKFDNCNIENNLNDLKSEVKNLNAEIKNLKSLLESNQILMERLLRIPEKINAENNP